MRYTILVFITVLVLLAGCTQRSLPKEVPQNGFDLHVDAKHYVKSERVMVHHWCKTMSDKLVECLLFDSDAANANLIGIETIVTNDIWNTFTEKQKAEWHDHATEIIEAEATLPDTPSEEAAKIVEFLKGTHGRVIYIWNFPSEDWPVTRPFLDSDKTK